MTRLWLVGYHSPVNDSEDRPHQFAPAGDFLATVWPVPAPNDTEVQRRKKFAVRSGHLAMVVMIVAAVVGSVASGFAEYPTGKLAALAAATIAFTAWSLYGTSGAARLFLWDKDPLPAQSTGIPRCGALAYFAIQLALAGLVYRLGDSGRTPAVLWLILLPAVANGVFLLERPGLVLVVLATAAVFVFNVVHRHGWTVVPYALLAFSFALIFTLVFTLLAVSSERARIDVVRLAGELAGANRKLREYAAQVEELAVTRERNRLAREVHDSLGHYLTVVNVQIEAARALQDANPARARAALDKARSLTQDGLQEIRRSVATLRASPLDNCTLADALRGLVNECRLAGLAAEMKVFGVPGTLSPQAALALYRAGQEGLTNVRKHSQAGTATLELDFTGPEKIRLSVSDDGRGVAAPEESAGGFGLLGVRERVQLLGGEVRIQTAPGAGFKLHVEVPG